MSGVTHAAFYANVYPDLREHFGKRLEALDIETRCSDSAGPRFEFVVRFRDVQNEQQSWEARLIWRGALTNEVVEQYGRILARQAIALEQAQLGMSPPLPQQETAP